MRRLLAIAFVGVLASAGAAIAHDAMGFQDPFPVPADETAAYSGPTAPAPVGLAPVIGAAVGAAT